MPINNNSAFYDPIDKIYWPKDYIKWDDLGNGFNSATTISNVNGVPVSNGALSFPQSHNGYWKLHYNDSIRLHNRTDWTIEFRIRINTDSTSTTNFQTSNDGIIICQGDGDIDAVSLSDRPNWVIYLDSSNQLNFGYYYSPGYSTSTSVAWKLGNDDYYDVSFKKSGLTLSLYINNEIKGVIILNSADIATSTEDLYIGGNPGGDYLYNADIDAIRIRKDNYSGNTLTANGDLHLVDNTLTSTPTYDGKWDTDVLLYLPVTESSGITTAQAYLKTFPGTWGDWTSWFVNPTHQIDVTTSTITFDEPTKGFRDVSVVTTDGFLCAYGAGAQIMNTDSSSSIPPSQTWRASTSGIHSQGGDIDFISPVKSWLGVGYYGTGRVPIETFSSTSLNVKIPSRGYYPAGETVGKRPRGLKKITYSINTKTVSENIVNRSDNNMFILGMPYFETSRTFPTQTFEGGIYKAGDIGKVGSGLVYTFRDRDFRWNRYTLHINSFGVDSANAVTVSTDSAHGLSTGDRVHMRLGVPWNATMDIHSDEAWNFFHAVNGVKWVQTISSTSFKLFYDSARTNPVNHTGTVPKFFSSTAQPEVEGFDMYIPNYKLRLAEWSKLFEGISLVQVGSSNQGIEPEYIENANVGWSQNTADFGDAYNNSQYFTPNNLNLNGKRSAFIGNSYTPGGTYDFKSIPKGTQADPFIITSKSGNYTTGSVGGPAAPLYIAMDARYSGTLKISISDVETADSTTPTQVKYSCIINGDGDSSGPKAFSTESFGNTISIDIGRATRAVTPTYGNYFNSMSLVVYLDAVVHTSNSDRSKATYTIWYEGNEDVGDHNALIYAGGLQPGRVTQENQNEPYYFEYNGIAENVVFRPGNWILYQGSFDNYFDTASINPTVNITVKGIPPIAYSMTGETYLSNRLDGANIQGGSGLTKQFYTGPYINEYKHGQTDALVRFDYVAAPWLEQTTMNVGMTRIYAGFVYECQQDHISSKNFDDDYNLGYWTVKFL